jgi:ankyrin repeat protein
MEIPVHNTDREAVSRTLMSHLNRCATGWVDTSGSRSICTSIHALLERENWRILKRINTVHETGEPRVVDFKDEEQGIALCVSILPGESWDDAKRFYARLEGGNGKPYLTWIADHLESARFEAQTKTGAELNWLAHWVILVRPLRSKPDSFWFNVGLSIVRRSEGRVPQVQVCGYCGDLLNPEELESFEGASNRAARLLLIRRKGLWEIDPALSPSVSHGRSAWRRFLRLLAKPSGAGKDRGGSQLHEAARDGDVEKMQALLKQSPDLVFSKDQYDLTPLHWAAIRGNKSAVELLLVNKAEVNASGDDGRTALMEAAENGHKEVLELLLANGADAGAHGGATLLHTAAWGGHTNVVELLLANKAEVNAKNIEGKTSLHWAVRANHNEVAELLLANKANVNAKDHDGQTPLHTASLFGTTAMLKLLLANGADANARNDWDNTPLHVAAMHGDNEKVELLLTNGADANARNEFDKTPLQTASDWRRVDVMELLRRHGGHE